MSSAAKLVIPLLTAGEPGCGNMVGVGPPLLASGPSNGSLMWSGPYHGDAERNILLDDVSTV